MVQLIDLYGMSGMKHVGIHQHVASPDFVTAHDVDIDFFISERFCAWASSPSILALSTSSPRMLIFSFNFQSDNAMSVFVVKTFPVALICHFKGNFQKQLIISSLQK